MNRHSFFCLLCFLFSFFSVFANELKIGQALEPPHLDPSQGAAGAIDEVVYGNIFEGLVTLNDKGEIKPLLAKKWTISEDKKTYIFDLQKDVFFHNKKKMTADDVVFSLQRIIAPDSINTQKSLFKSIQGVYALNPYQVKIQLKNVDQNLIYFLTWGDAVIFQKENSNKNKNLPIGTGPFQLQKWLKGTRIELAKNKNYWGKKAKVDKVSFIFITDPSSAYYSLLSGEIDAYPNFPSPENLVTFEKNKNFQVIIGNTEGETLLAMNNNNKELANKKVRQAIQHAVNKKEIIQAAMYGYAKTIGSHFSPNHPDYLDLSEYYEYNLKKAKKLMKEAGYENGFEASLKLPPPFYAKRSGEVLLHQLKKINIKLKIINVEWAIWLNEVFKEKKYDFTIISHTEPYDFFIYARDNYYFNYQNPLFNEKIEKLSVLSGMQKKELHQRLAKILTEDAVNVFLFQLPKLGVWKKGITGFWSNSPLQANVLKNLQVTTQP